MLALFIDHRPMFVAGEIALGLSLALFIRASVAAIADRASGDTSIARSSPLSTIGQWGSVVGLLLMGVVRWECSS